MRKNAEKKGEEENSNGLQTSTEDKPTNTAIASHSNAHKKLGKVNLLKVNLRRKKITTTSVGLSVSPFPVLFPSPLAILLVPRTAQHKTKTTGTAVARLTLEVEGRTQRLPSIIWGRDDPSNTPSERIRVVSSQSVVEMLRADSRLRSPFPEQLCTRTRFSNKRVTEVTKVVGNVTLKSLAPWFLYSCTTTGGVSAAIPAWSKTTTIVCDPRVPADRTVDDAGEGSSSSSGSHVVRRGESKSRTTFGLVTSSCLITDMVTSVARSAAQVEGIPAGQYK